MRLSTDRRRQQLSLHELYQVNWFLGAILALLSIWPTAYLNLTMLPHLAGALLLIGISFVRPQVVGYLPKIVWQIVPFLLVIILAIDLHLTRELVPALVRLNISLVLYRCLAFRRKREDLQLIILSLFLIIMVGVITVSVAFPLQVLLFTAVAMSFLFNITLMENSRDTLVPREIWRDFTWRRFIRTLRAHSDPGFFIVAGIAFSSLIVLSVILFVAIPRFDVNNPIPFLGFNRAARTGFSESIRFGDVTDIQQDNRVALRVEVKSADKIPPEPYWRMLVLDEYVDGGFRLSAGLQQNAVKKPRLSRIDRRQDLIANPEKPRSENVWTFYLEGGVARFLPLTGTFNRIRFEDPHDFMYMPPTHVLGMHQVNSRMLVYQVQDMDIGGRFKDPRFGEYTLEYDWYPEIGFSREYRFLTYPDTTMELPSLPEDVAYLEELVQEIGKGEALTALEFAERASRWLQRNYGYSMSYSIEPGPSDEVVRWMRSAKAGHCEVFAGALLLLCRTAGIPARVVTGFRGGAWNAFENYFMVRNSDAHAWVEIFDGVDTWIPLDPTPGSNPTSPGDSEGLEVAQFSSDSSFSAYLDSLRILWYRRIVSFDQSSQSEIWSAVERTWNRIRIKERWESFKDLFKAWLTAPWSLGRFLEILGILAAGGVFVILILYIGRTTGITRGTGDPIRRKAGRQLQRILALPPPADPDAAWEKSLEEIVFDLQRLRFGRQEGHKDWQKVIQRARRFVRAWR